MCNKATKDTKPQQAQQGQTTHKALGTQHQTQKTKRDPTKIQVGQVRDAQEQRAKRSQRHAQLEQNTTEAKPRLCSQHRDTNVYKAQTLRTKNEEKTETQLLKQTPTFTPLPKRGKELEKCKTLKKEVRRNLRLLPPEHTPTEHNQGRA